MKNVLKITVFSAFLVVGVFAAAPKVHADITFNPMNPIDPFCLFSCPKPQPTTVNNTVNSNNTNSFNNNTAPISGTAVYQANTDGHTTAVVNPTTTYTPTSPYQSTTPVTPTNTNTNYNYNYNTGSGTTYVPTPVYQTPVYYSTPTYYSTPSYPIYYTQPTYYTQPYQYPVYGTTYQQPYYYNQQYYYNQPISYAPSIQIACAADRTSAGVGIPVTWSAEATYNGMGSGFAYSWSGTDGLYGNAASTIMAYYSTGVKSAVVTVTAPNGVTSSKVCSNTVTVKSGTTVVKAPVKKVAVATPKVVTPTPTPTPEVVSAASLFSLGNVPWGWVGILIILVLLGVIFYLIFNRKKI